MGILKMEATCSHPFEPKDVALNVEHWPLAGDQRELSRRTVLDIIRKSGKIARIDIAASTGLSPATVTATAVELFKAGLIEEIASDESAINGKRGRPRVMLKIRGDACKLAGIKIAHHAISVLIVDFEGIEIFSYEYALDEAVHSPENLAAHIMVSITNACHQVGLQICELAGMGIALAGQVDVDRGFVHWSSSLDRRGVNMREILGDCMPCPVFIDNDANLIAKAEQLFGLGKGLRNFLVVTIEHGVGIGIVANSSVYRGSHGCGAEFGHLKVELQGRDCQCGQRGCLEAYVSDYGLLRQANKDGANYRDIKELFDASGRGEEKASEVINQARQVLATGIANLVNLFDPDLVILAGRQSPYLEIYEDKLVEEVKGLILQVDLHRFKLKFHDWGDRMWAKGAAAYAIETVSTLFIREQIANTPHR